MRTALLSAVLAAVVALPAQSQPDRSPPAATDTIAAPDSRGPAVMGAPSPARRTMTLALPYDRGVFYYRAGEPGGVRIRSRAGRRLGTPPPGAAPQGVTRAMIQDVVQPILDEFFAARAPRTGAAPGSGVSELELLLLEQDLLRAVDRRLAGLSTGRDRTVYVSPSDEPAVVVDSAPAAPTPVIPATPAPAVGPPSPVPVDPIVVEVERAILDTGLLVTNRVNFEFGEATLIPISERLLRTIGDILLRYPDIRVRVGGHTDSVSSEDFNLRLSLARANTVRDFLIGYGVDADRLEAVGYGEGEPIATNGTETGRALNRRVEFTVLNRGEAERRTGRPAPDERDDDLHRIIREELERLRDGGG